MLGELVPDSGFRRSFNRYQEEKILLAGYAVENYVSNESNVVIDFGSTCTFFANRLARSDWRGVRVATHSISVASQFLDSPAIETCYVFGGMLRNREAALFPTGRVRDWKPFGGSPYTAIVTAESFSQRGGAAESRQEIVRLVRLYLSEASEVIMLIDHSKFQESNRFTATWCGLKPEDSWLKRPVPFKLVTDTRWETDGESSGFGVLRDHPRFQITEGRDAFSQITVFESELMPSTMI